MVRRVPRRVQGAHLARAEVEHLVVRDQTRRAGDTTAVGNHVLGPAEARGCEPAADGVVVHVGVEHVGDVPPAVANESKQRVDVARGVDEECRCACHREVGAVAQPGNLEGHHARVTGDHIIGQGGQGSSATGSDHVALTLGVTAACARPGRPAAG